MRDNSIAATTITLNCDLDKIYIGIISTSNIEQSLCVTPLTITITEITMRPKNLAAHIRYHFVFIKPI